jgi:inner membrane protein
MKDQAKPALPIWKPNRSPGLKLLLVCFLALLMTIPALFVFGIVSDRAQRSRSVETEISQSSGGEQTVVGPVLVIPIESTDAGGIWRATDTLLVFADRGTVQATLDVQTKRKSLYGVQVYDSDMAFSAHFDLAELKARISGEHKLLLNQAQILIGVSDLKGALADAQLQTRNAPKRLFEPFGGNANLQRSLDATKLQLVRPYGRVNDEMDGDQLLMVHLGSALSVSVGDLLADESFDVEVSLRLSGATRFQLVPFARTTEIHMASNWPDPGFEGGFLPTEKQITETGFAASRTIPALASGLPKLAFASKFGNWGTRSSPMAVKLVNKTSPYQYVTRSLKYALMFIGFVFLSFFLFEMGGKTRTHAAQYVLIGLAQSIFYLLLLALAEHIGFDFAFLLAAGATVVLTGLYAGSVFGKNRTGFALLIFACVYGLQFVLMRMEDYALLVGAMASFGAIAITMWMTRNMQWYGQSET